MLLRIVPLMFLFGGLALIVDYFAPPRRQSAVVESRDSWMDMEGETVYEVSISGGDLKHCHLDATAYDMLREGDRIEISASHLFDSCTRVMRGQEQVYRTRAQPLVALVFGLLLFVPGLMVTIGPRAKRKSVSEEPMAPPSP
jgi:hypothetical protein